MSEEVAAVGAAAIVVGVVSGQPDRVVEQAARFAALMSAQLICASVDPSRYAVQELADGSVRSLPVDPDLPDRSGNRSVQFDPTLARHLAAILDPRGVQWSVRALAGEPARALARLAETVDAAMIVVGTREHRGRLSVQSFFGGSVAVHLAHRQSRPLLIVPLSPVAADATLPWES